MSNALYALYNYTVYSYDTTTIESSGVNNFEVATENLVFDKYLLIVSLDIENVFCEAC